MIFKELSIDNISVKSINEINSLNILNELIDSIYGRIFVVNKENKLLGHYSVDNYTSDNKTLYLIKTCPRIKESEDYNKQLHDVLSQSVYYGILPIINNDGVLKGALTCTDSVWDNDLINWLSKIDYYRNKGSDIGYYFYKRGIKRIAFYGLNKGSLALSDALLGSKYGFGESVVVYSNNKLKKHIDIDYLNYEVNVVFVDSFADIIKNTDLDMIIVTDWTMRNLAQIDLSRITKAKIVYANVLLNSTEFSQSINAQWFQNCREQLQSIGVSCLSVRVPTENDLGISKPKKSLDDFPLSERFLYWEREEGLVKDSEEFAEFSKGRKELPEKIIKKNGLIYFSNYKSNYFNYINKSRIVLNIPNKFENTVYLVGSCIISGLFSSDKHTLGYFLQDFLNEAGFRIGSLRSEFPMTQTDCISFGFLMNFI